MPSRDDFVKQEAHIKAMPSKEAIVLRLKQSYYDEAKKGWELYRQAKAELQAERDEYADLQLNYNECANQRNDLKAQLAAAQARIRELEADRN